MYPTEFIIWTALSYGLNMKGRVIGQENGHPLLLTVFHNISDTTKIYEDIIDEASVGILVGDDTTRETIFINQSAKNLVDAVFDGSVENFIWQSERQILSRRRGEVEVTRWNITTGDMQLRQYRAVGMEERRESAIL